MSDINVQSKFLKKIIAVLLSCLIILSLVPTPESFAGDNVINIAIKTAGIEVKLTDNKGNVVSYDSTKTDEEGYLSYSYNISPGEYLYSSQQGGGSITVGENTKEIIFRQVLLPIETEQQFDVTISDEKGNAYSRGKIYADGSKPTVKRVPFLLPAYGSQVKYNYKFIPEDKETYWGSCGSLYIYPNISPDLFTTLNLSDVQLDGFIIKEKANIRIEVPTGAELHLYHRTRFYRPLEEIDVNLENTVDGYDIYSCNVPLTYLHYEVSQPGKITKGEYFNAKDYISAPLKVSPLIANNNIQIKTASQKYFAANILLNGPSSKYLTMNVGEHFDIFASRAWQAVNSITGNYYMDPKFHYEVKQGSSVTVSDDGIIRAVEKGISVIEVSYDAIDWQGLVYDPIWKENTGIFIINVDPGLSEKINIGINLNEFDTIYYLKSQNGESKENHATYTFKPSAVSNISVRVQKPLQTNWNNGWTSYTPDKNGLYTVDLYDGRNIIEISAGNSVEYYVVKASGLSVNIENADNPLKPIVVGSPISIKFTDLESPFPKLGAVYNPGYPSEDWVQYNWGGAQVDSEHVQYTLRTDNEIRLIADGEGKVNLTNGKIHTSVIGDKSTGHQSLTNRASKVSSYVGQDSDVSFNGYLCTLPDITFEVFDNDQLEEQKKLEYAELEILGADGKPFMDQLGHNQLGHNIIHYSQASNTQPTTKNLSFKCNTKNNSDIKILVKYWTETNKEIKEIEVKNGEMVTIPKFITLDNIFYAEIISIPNNPDDGYIQTYDLYGMFKTQLKGTPPPKLAKVNDYYGRKAYLTDLQVVPVENSLDYKSTDGKLLAISDGTNLGFGYNFLSTKKEYTCTVPYSTKKVKINAVKESDPQLKKFGGDSIFPNQHLTSDSEVKIYVNGKIVKENDKPIELSGSEALITVESMRTRTAGTSQVKGGEITWQNPETDTQIYTIKVLRAEPPKFLNISSSDNVIIKVKDGSKFIKQNDKGLYELEEGKTYDVIAMMDGYISKVIPYKVTSEDNQALEIKTSDLEKAPNQTGTVTVQTTGYNSILRSNMTVSIEEPKDLLLQKYVEYNHGGYTALHALVDAFNTGISKVKFSCYKGNLKPEFTVDATDHGSNAGWVCEVNGKVCNPEITLVNNEDKVDYYYNSDYEGMQHAWFKNNVINVKQGDNAELSLLGTKVNNDGSEATAIAGATIKVNGKAISEAVTNEKGSIIIPSSLIGDPGQYTVTAEKSQNGKNILTYCVALINVKKVDAVPEEGKITVKFRLIGDAKHDGISEHGKYVTWIATKKMTFTGKSVSVYDVFTKALDEAGLEYVGAEKNYVSKIKAPKAYGGYWLAEFTNGKNSGWMYTVNGDHPLFGLKDYYVTDGDVIIWHYVDDYKLETSFEGSKPSYPNRWLEAEDKNPPTDKVVDMSKGNKEKVEEVKNNSAISTVDVKANLNSKGQAEASVSSKEMTESLKKALEAVKESKKNLKPEVVIAVKADSKANALITTIPTASGKDLAKEKGILSLTTPIGDITFDTEALNALVSEAAGSDIKLTIEKVDVSKDKVISGITTLTDRPVFNLLAISKDREITNFKNGKVTFYLPYTLGKNENKNSLKITYISDDGVQTILSDSSYDESKKAMKGTTNHFSYYAITNNNTAAFNDVTSEKWFYESVMFLVNRGILKGKTEKAFAPNDNITRAEFIAILARISGQTMPEAGKNFTDVKDTNWYAKYVTWAVNVGIAKGLNEKEFAPNANISRQDMAAMVARYSDYMKKNISGTNKEIKFTDEGTIAGYAKESVSAMQKAGIINGVKATDGSYSFAPKNNATRAECSKMIAVLMQNFL